MRKSKRYKKKQLSTLEFSKLIYLINLGFVAVVTGLSFLCVIMSGIWGISDLSPIAVICTSAFTSLSVVSLFYYRKAQAENVLKISKQIQKDNIDLRLEYYLISCRAVLLSSKLHLPNLPLHRLNLFR